MDYRRLDKKIESNQFYQLTQRHRKVILIIQGLFIIGLLIAMNMYVYKDHFLKKQIAENCGYTTSKYKCICEAHYVEDWEEGQKGFFEINLTGDNGKLVG